MLFQRVITALILIPLVVAAVIYLPSEFLALLLGVAVLLGALEWTRLSQIDSVAGKALFLLLLAGVMAGLWPLTGGSWRLLASAAGLFSLFWVVVTLYILHFQPGMNLAEPVTRKIGMGLMVLAPAWISLLILHARYEDGPYLVLFLMVLIWVADSFAYFAGRRWGRVKLAPLISPGKSREGVYGAMVGAALCGLLLHQLRPETGPLHLLVILSVLVALISVIGDLFESLMKRQAGLKDSGNLLPGHGGMLDRIDSLTAAAPLFLLGMLLLEAAR
jgi:phosphatidate cytidylyltransferase